MSIEEKIKRRKRRQGANSLICDEESLSAVCHLDEPVGREPVVQLLFEYLDPVFEGELPPKAYLWGPMGSGKSAVVTALFSTLKTEFSQPGAAVDPVTRPRSPAETPTIAYIDARRVATEFSLYRAILSVLVDERVPKRGVGADTLLERLQERLARPACRAVVAVDHVGEPETYSLSALAGMLDTLGSSLSWLAIGRQSPTGVTAEAVEIPAYNQQTLREIVSIRAAAGLDEQAIRDDQIEKIANWADGNAHDALAVLSAAAGLAADRDRSRLRDTDLVDAITDMPRQSVSLSRVLSLPANRKQVLQALLDARETECASIASAAAAIASSAGVDLSVGTVERFLYELAEAGIVERVHARQPADSTGRPTSSVEPCFSPTVFEQLSAFSELP